MRLNRLGPLILVLASCAGAGPSVPPASGHAGIAFVDVAVVSPRDGTKAVHQTVLVNGDRIVKVGGQISVPPGAQIIEGHGRFLVPGFADMHVHLPSSRAEIERVLDLSIAAGVTVIRGMQGSPDHLVVRAQLEREYRPRPELVLAGPPIDAALTPEEARGLVQVQKHAGFDLIKVLGHLDRAAYDALVEEAKVQHIPVVGHVPAEIGLTAAIAARQRSIEHVQGYVRDAHGDLAMVATLARQTRAAGIWNCPTLDFFNVALGPRDALAARDGIVTYATDEELTAWTKTLADRPRPADADSRLHDVATAIAALRNAGAPLLIGSDTPDTYALPGFGYVEELRAMARLGMSPLEVLRAATLNAAGFLDRPQDGMVTAGARADLVLLDRDPTANVENLSHPAGVMVRGHWMPRPELDRLLAAHRALR